jgi:hypothetical protein
MQNQDWYSGNKTCFTKQELYAYAKTCARLIRLTKGGKNWNAKPRLVQWQYDLLHIARVVRLCQDLCKLDKTYSRMQESECKTKTCTVAARLVSLSKRCTPMPRLVQGR